MKLNDKFFSHLLIKSNGMSVIEALASMAIASVMFFSLLPLFVNQSRLVKNISDSGQCRSLLYTISSKIDKLKVVNNSSGVIAVDQSNFAQTVDSPALTNEPLRIPAQLQFRFDAVTYRPTVGEAANYDTVATPTTAARLFYQNRSASLTYAEGGNINVANNGVTLYTPLLLDGPIASLADFYNLQGFSSRLEISAALPDTSLYNVDNLITAPQPGFTARYYMRIVPYDLDGLGNAAPAPLWPRPRNNQGFSNVTLEPYTGAFQISRFPPWMSDRFGLKVILEADVTQANSGQTDNCSIEKDYAYGFDYQNTLDVINDFKTLRFQQVLPNKVSNFDRVASAETGLFRDNSSNASPPNILSSKNTVAGQLITAHTPDSIGLLTIFTNRRYENDPLNPPYGVKLGSGSQRNVCSNNGQIITDSSYAFSISFRVYDLINKEPGSVPLCIDFSKQHLAGEPTGPGQGWCTQNYVGDPGGSVEIVRDWTTRGTGWVPCERLKLCGESPDRVQTSIGNDAGRTYYEYKYYFNELYADNNRITSSSRHRRFWGCELKYGLTVVDPAGNIAYPPAEMSINSASMDQNSSKVPRLKEVNPRVYFKPPPCTVCGECKTCKKRGKGGFLRILSQIFAFTMMLTFYVTMFGMVGPILPVDPGLLGVAGFGALNSSGIYKTSTKLLCQWAAVGCPQNNGPVTSYPRTTCRGQHGCPCGTTCSTVYPPPPDWGSDTVSTCANPTDPACADPRSCDKEIGSEVVIAQLNSGGTASITINPIKAYKAGTAYPYTYSDEKVKHADQILWQEFIPDLSGKSYFCSAQYECDDGAWKHAKYEYFDNAGNPVQTDLVQCAEVKVARRVNWKSNYSRPDVSSPKQNQNICLEVDYKSSNPPYNYTTDHLWSEAETEVECGKVSDPNDTSLTFLPFANPADPGGLLRVYGKRATGGYPAACASTETIDLPDGSSQTFALVTQDTINVVYNDYDGDGYPDNFSGTGWQPECQTDPVNGGYLPNTSGALNSYGMPWMCEPIVRRCWVKCDTPEFAPSGPMNTDPYGVEPTIMKFYETANPATDSNLPFCTMDRSTFDKVN